MRILIITLLLLMSITLSNAQSGIRHFDTLLELLAVTPDPLKGESINAYVLATNSKYYWDGAIWKLEDLTDDQTAAEVPSTDGDVQSDLDARPVRDTVNNLIAISSIGDRAYSDARNTISQLFQNSFAGNNTFYFPELCAARASKDNIKFFLAGLIRNQWTYDSLSCTVTYTGRTVEVSDVATVLFTGLNPAIIAPRAIQSGQSYQLRALDTVSALSYQWSQTSGTSVTINQPQSVSPWIDVPFNIVAGNISLRCIIQREGNTIDTFSSVIQTRPNSSPFIDVTAAPYNATFDGTTDDRNAIQSAIIAAANANTGVLLPSGLTARLSNGLDFYNGITFFGSPDSLNPSTLKYDVGSAWCMTMFGPTTLSRPEMVKNLTVANCILTGPSAGVKINGVYNIRGEDASNISLIRVKIVDGTTNAIHFTAPASDSLDSVTGILIANCEITKEADIGLSIVIATSLEVGPISTLWLAEHRAAKALRKSTNHSIINNIINGGYYGISLSGVSGVVIKGNIITNNVRNISLQNLACNNTIKFNDISESTSSGIYMGYGSSNNIVRFNSITSARAVGEGMLQCYVGSSNNMVTDNTVICTGANGPGWQIYNAIHADNNTFARNSLFGSCTKSYIGVDADWDPTWTSEIAHRSVNVGTGWANRNTFGINIIDNVIEEIADSSPNTRLLFVGSPVKGFRVTDLNITGNVDESGNPITFVIIERQ